MIKTLLRGALGTLVLLTLLVALTLAWLMGTEGGTSMLVGLAERYTPGSLVVEGASGRLGRAVCAKDVSYQRDRLLVAVAGGCVGVDLLGLLFDDELRVTTLRADEVRIEVAPGDDAEAARNEIALPEFSLPVEVVVADGRINRLVMPGTELESLALTARARQRRVIVERLALRLDTLNIGVRGSLAWSGRGEAIMDVDFSHPQVTLTAELHGALNALTTTVELTRPITAVARGSINLLDANLPFRLETRQDRLALEQWTGRPGELSGVLTVQGDVAAYRFDARGEVRDSEFGPLAIEASGHGDWQSLESDVRGNHDFGQISGLVAVRWLPDLVISARGELSREHQATTLSGRYAGSWTPAEVRLSSLELAAGAGRLAGHGVLRTPADEDPPSLEAQLTLTKLDASLVDERVGGLISGTLTAEGSLSAPLVNGVLDATGLRFSDYASERASLTLETFAGGFTMPRMDLIVAGLRRGELELGKGRLQVQGGPRGSLELRWDQRVANVALHMDYELEGGSYRNAVLGGTLTSVDVEGSAIGAWNLSEPMAVSARRDRVTLAPACLLNGLGARLCMNLDLDAGAGTVSLEDYRIAGDLPNDAGSYATEIRIDGQLTELFTEPRGGLNIALLGTTLSLVESESTYTLGDVSGEIALTPTAISARLVSHPDSPISLAAEVRSDGLDATAPISGSIELGLDNLALLDPLLPVTVSRPAGVLRLNAAVFGSLAQPQWTGTARWLDGRLEVAALGLRLAEMQAEVQADPTVTATARLTSGSGSVKLDATSDLGLPDLAASFEANISLDRATIVDLPDYRAVASGSLTARREADVLRVAGALTVPEARVRMNRIPETSVTPSADVVVVDAVPEDRLQRDLDVTVRFGEQVRVSGFGLDTRVAGQLRVLESRQGVPRVSGNLDLREGTFEGYGQAFTIERGRLIFDGPVDNPLLDIVATRTVKAPDEVYRLNVSLSGPATSIVTRVTAEPAVPDADALSLLVNGRLLHDSTRQDRINIASAAAALGVKGASRIGGQIGESLGLDEVIVEGDQDNLIVGAGMQLSQDVYLRYTYDVFSKLGGVLLNYALSDRLSLEARSGDAQSIHLRYQVDR